jgi:hypothetical protein
LRNRTVPCGFAWRMGQNVSFAQAIWFKGWLEERLPHVARR